MKGKRFASIFVACILIFSFLFSIFFPSMQAHHIHENEDTCAICSTIQECYELQRSLANANASTSEEGLSSKRPISFRVRSALSQTKASATLVSLKVKLSN